MTVRIVPTSAEYFAGFRAVVDAVARERKYLGYVEAPPVEQTTAFVRSLIEGAGVQMLALDGSQVVGWCDITRIPWEGARHVGRLGMGLLPAYRGKGHGTRLLEHTLDAARKAGVERVELDVFASNTSAIRFYEKLGFQHEGLKRHYRKLDGVYDDCLIMALLALG